jgi:hypothetical protein
LTATARTVGQLSSGFMFDPATYAVGGEHGFEGISFYGVASHPAWHVVGTMRRRRAGAAT